MSQHSLQQNEIHQLQKALNMHLVATSSRKRAVYKQGEFFDPDYHQDHAQELAERKRDEEEAKRKRAAKIEAKNQSHLSNSQSV